MNSRQFGLIINCMCSESKVSKIMRALDLGFRNNILIYLDFLQVVKLAIANFHSNQVQCHLQGED
jgi:hypothetical protein